MFKNTNGTWVALGAMALLGAVTVVKRGSRATGLQRISLPGVHGRIPYFTADYIEEADITALADEVSEAYSGFIYVPTKAELQALNWMGDRTSIGALLLASMREIPVLPRTLGTAGNTQTAIVISDLQALKKALSDDGADRIPGLSEDLPIQRLIWPVAH